jgi:phosphonate transport system substrate-binding protein
VEDKDYWKDFIRTVYADEGFVNRFGTLPHVEDLHPDLGPDAANPSSVAYVETVVVDAARPMRFGLSPALGVAVARTQGDRVAAWLKKKLDRDVRSVVLADYQALIDAIADGEIDFAWMPPVAFVRATNRGVGLVALAQRLGRPTYESAIVVREDSPIKDVTELAGKSIAFVDRESASGYLYAYDVIARALGDGKLGEQHFVGSHRATCDAVVRGWTAAGVTYVVRDDAQQIVHSGWLDRGGTSAPLRPIAFTDPIPCDALAHRPGLASALVDKLARAMVEIDTNDEEGVAVLKEVFYTTAMMPADLRIYDEVRDTMRRTKIA